MKVFQQYAITVAKALAGAANPLTIPNKMAYEIWCNLCRKDFAEFKSTLRALPEKREVYFIVQWGLGKKLFREAAKELSRFSRVMISITLNEKRHVDLSFLELLPNMTGLFLNQMPSVTNMELIGTLKKLKRLDIGDIDRKSGDIGFLEGMPKLEELELWRRGQECEVLATLPKLRDLHLVSCKLNNAEFLTRCRALRHLRVTLGSWKDPGPTAEWAKTKIEEIGLDRLKGLPDLKFAQAVPSVCLNVQGMNYLRKA